VATLVLTALLYLFTAQYTCQGCQPVFTKKKQTLSQKTSENTR